MIKNKIQLLLILLFTIILNSIVFAQNIQELDIRSFSGDYNGTYIVTNSNELYINSENGFEKIADDVKEVYANNNDFNGNIAVLKNNSDLYLYDISYK